MLPGAPALNRQLAPTARTLEAFALNPGVQGGHQALDPALRLPQPGAPVRGPGADGVQLRDAAWPATRRTLSSISPDGIGTAQRFIVMSAGQIRRPFTTGVNAPNSENGPSSAPANSVTARFAPTTTSSTPTRTRTPPRPASTRECEAGNEPYLPNQVVIGNVPGNQGTVTEGQLQR